MKESNTPPGLIEEAKNWIWTDYFLDRLPGEATTLESGFQYLARRSNSDLIREVMESRGVVYGLEFEHETAGIGSAVFLYSPVADFSGDIVYVVMEGAGYPRSVFLRRRP